jgi:hypothetical protein
MSGPQQVRIDGQSANSLARSCEDGVAERRRDWRNTRLANPSWRRVAVDDRDVRRDVDAGDRVVGKIALLDLAPLDRDIAAERIAETHDDGAFRLSAHTVGIDDEAVIHGHIDDPKSRHGDISFEYRRDGWRSPVGDGWFGNEQKRFWLRPPSGNGARKVDQAFAVD